LKYLIGFIVLVLVSFVSFAVGWNGGRDMEHARMTGASEFPAQPQPVIRQEDLASTKAHEHGFIQLGPPDYRERQGELA
jgi:hypothetical protein